MSSIITVQNLVKMYNQGYEYALKNVSLEVEKGSLFALLGPNGSGKTTVMSILITALNKTSGKVNIAGYDLDSCPRQIRKNIGVIFQKPSMDFTLTAEENIRFHAAIYHLFPYRPTYNMMPDSYKKRLSELAQLLSMEHKMFDKISTFSGGMRRRFEIIRGLMHKPKILFLDEPTTGIDPISRKDLWDYLKTVKEQDSVTIFFTTHYLNEVEEADKFCIINKGEIIISGSPKEIKNKLIKEFVLFETTDNEKLNSELNEKKIKFSIFNNRKIKVELSNSDIIKFIKQAKSPITSLQTVNPTLEEAYLEIIKNSNDS